MILDELYNAFIAKERWALSKAITLIESSKQEHQIEARQFLKKLDSTPGQARIIGISGTPGVGKSTFIETLGNELVKDDKQLAVLAIDPTSYQSGGSILGDMTRMPGLSGHKNVYIRPSPSGKHLGGVAKKTKETIRLCEAFGVDTIIIETVGVGQSEVAVSSLVDYFILLMQPAAGDELQGIKRGILELCDAVIVNKADGSLLSKAKNTKTELELALHILRKETVPILLVSALERQNIDQVEELLEVYFKKNQSRILEKRSEQQRVWLEQFFVDEIVRNLKLQEHYSQTINDPAFSIELIEKRIEELNWWR